MPSPEMKEAWRLPQEMEFIKMSKLRERGWMWNSLVSRSS